MATFRPVLLRGIARGMREARGRKLPLIAGHKLLYSCNLKCRMCPFWRRKDEKLLSLQEEVRMMNALADAGVLFMGFEGGEPFLRRDLPEVLRESHERFHTSLVTNGVMLKERFPEVRRYLENLFVSLDGIGEVHDKIRGVEGAFKKTVEGIRMAKDYVETTVNVTLGSDNLHQATEMVRLVEELGVSVSFQVAYDYSTAEKMSPEKERLREVLTALLRMKLEGAPIVNSKEYFEAILSSWYGGKPWTCKPWLTINVDPQGRIVSPCYVLNEYRGEARAWEVDIEQLWNSYDWSKYETCNRCGLTCYLEPSLFDWRNLSMVKERILSNAFDYLFNVVQEPVRVVGSVVR
ncbi:radical SAM protein [Sulfodiicoccus acidiphilus]|uniref:Radical SAM protein n=1 Tax=Sulfodiicoccus acidiphilus TaxID=1670455 RepID=A0A830H6M4_9CREN|nr:PTO1314 family radical SAM protein [Sulfodiicoccus acidiphilus]GGU05201.1 radical SAM protein [Sulfodiicoccus acidiphilus]